MDNQVSLLVDFIKSLDGKTNKSGLTEAVQREFSLTRDRSVFYNNAFAIRFSSSKTKSFSNTVISLSNLQKYDDLPFIVCLNTPEKNYLFLANTTLIEKVSHSSQALREDNIRGSINGSDIKRKLNGIINTPENFSELFAIHSEIGFSGNLPRLVEATNNISPTGHKYQLRDGDEDIILHSPERAQSFVESEDFSSLKEELDETVHKYEKEIILASLIDNVNLRGRVIEHIIAGKDDAIREELLEVLRKGTKKIMSFRTKNTLGDFEKIFENYATATDIKTKIMVLNSAPKAYNLDKILEFLAIEKTVFLFYFVGIMPGQIVGTALISMFQKDLLSTTHLLAHWAGRNSRGVAQFSGGTIDTLIECPNNTIDLEGSQKFLKRIIGL